jgi:MFS family permease
LTSILRLLSDVPAARRFFAVHLQSSLGTGMGYVALVLIALERFHSAWAVAVILLADLLPLMLLGPVLGGVADRLPRRPCAVAADLLRGAAFLGIAVAGQLWLVIVLAALAGAGTGVFRPAVLAGLPHLAGERYHAAATSLFGAITTLGQTLGPLLAAALLLGDGAGPALAVNGASFLISAAVLCTIDLGRPAPRRPDAVDRPARRGFPAPGLAVVAAIAGATALFAGMANVAEPGYIAHDLAAGGRAFSIMVGLYGMGFAVGSLTGANGGSSRRLWALLVAGVFAEGAGYTGAALAPAFIACLPGFALAGVGNGMLIVHQRLLVHELAPPESVGVAYGTVDMATSWAFAGALLVGAVVVAGAGSRMALLLAGTGTLAACFAAALWQARHAPAAQSA